MNVVLSRLHQVVDLGVHCPEVGGYSALVFGFRAVSVSGLFIWEDWHRAAVVKCEELEALLVLKRLRRH